MSKAKPDMEPMAPESGDGGVDLLVVDVERRLRALDCALRLHSVQVAGSTENAIEVAEKLLRWAERPCTALAAAELRAVVGDELRALDELVGGIARLAGRLDQAEAAIAAAARRKDS